LEAENERKGSFAGWERSVRHDDGEGRKRAVLPYCYLLAGDEDVREKEKRDLEACSGVFW